MPSEKAQQPSGDGDRPTNAESGGRWFRYAQQLWGFIDGGYLGRLTPAAVSAYVILLKHADADTLVCNPSLAGIAGLSAKHATTVADATAELERAGLLSRKRGGGRYRTEYTLTRLHPLEPLAKPLKGEDAKAPLAKPLEQLSQDPESSLSEKATRTPTSETVAKGTTTKGPFLPAGRRKKGRKSPSLDENDPILKAICKVFGFIKVPDSQKSLFARVVRELKEQGATPEEIEVRHERIMRTWSTSNPMHISKFPYWYSQYTKEPWECY